MASIPFLNQNGGGAGLPNVLGSVGGGGTVSRTAGNVIADYVGGFVDDRGKKNIINQQEAKELQYKYHEFNFEIHYRYLQPQPDKL